MHSILANVFRSFNALDMGKRELKVTHSPGNVFIILPPGLRVPIHLSHMITLSYADFKSYLQVLLIQ